MAHPTEKRTQLRGLYVHQRLAMDLACLKVGVPRSTANRWKADALAKGDDWDVVRSAVALGNETFNTLSRQLLEDYLIQHQAAMASLREATGMSAMDRAEALASLSDAFNKTMASFKRLAPDLNRQAVQLDTLKMLATFATTRFPQHIAALAEMLEPFGEELAKAG